MLRGEKHERYYVQTTKLLLASETCPFFGPHRPVLYSPAKALDFRVPSLFGCCGLRLPWDTRMQVGSQFQKQLKMGLPGAAGAGFCEAVFGLACY